jgi:hypothetical protein
MSQPLNVHYLIGFVRGAFAAEASNPSLSAEDMILDELEKLGRLPECPAPYGGEGPIRSRGDQDDDVEEKFEREDA